MPPSGFARPSAITRRRMVIVTGVRSGINRQDYLLNINNAHRFKSWALYLIMRVIKIAEGFRVSGCGKGFRTSVIFLSPDC